MEPAFAFTFTYDPESARVAARTLFVETWRVFLPVVLVSPVVTIGGFFLFGSVLGVWDLAWLLAWLLLLSVLSSAYLYWSTTRRIVQSMTGTAQVSLTDSDLSMSRPDLGSHVLPWKMFKFAKRDAKNLLLFMSSRAAIVIPTSALSEGAISFVVAHVHEKK